ncbi:Uncharacterised protein [Metamycoplasma cloacale]|uniref:Uncharacterized protein n=1 Tax=Metamycoplasma cloacale TaxID=92401 RepID=A0A2Z4LLL1_9BACT|nr:hypothetical protein [Metamycoplasma cloacale]AWX42596.1 hypothetical protein DK849_00655 [Metamycoplasma cloacale]VEU79672.1 Uncharacterised protein [Metamycoplasma cloacale]
MKRNRLPIFLALVPTLGIVPTIVSCSYKTAYLDIEKISRKYLTRLTGNQVASLHNSNKIFYFLDGNQKVYFDSAVFEDNTIKLIHNKHTSIFNIDFPIQKYWKQEISNLDNIKVIETNEKSNINDFFNVYDFNEIDDANGFNEQWFSILASKFNYDFDRVGDPYFADIQTILFRLIQDGNINYSYMNKRRMINKDNQNVLLKDYFTSNYIQAKTFLSNEYQLQRELFESFLCLYLNKFNVGISRIEIDWDNAREVKSFSGNSSYIAIKFKGMYDFKNQNILNNENQEKTFYINDFRTYATDQKFGVGNNGLKEELPLFNEYIENPLLEIDGKQYLNIVDNINYFIKGVTSFEYWNTKGLMSLFQNFKDDFFYIKVPENKKDTDVSYKIIDFKYTDYLNTDQLIKAIVRVFKKDKSYKDYVWISSNFDDHGHRLKAKIINNKREEDLTINDFYYYKKDNIAIPAGISLNEFLKPSSNYPNSPYEILLERAFNNLNLSYSYWNNDLRENYEANWVRQDSFQIKLLTSFLNNYLLSYALENKEGNVYSGVKRIDLEILDNQTEIGRIKLRMKFMSYANEQDFNYKTEGERILKEVDLYWNGFKGFDKSISSHLVSIIPEKGGEN